MTAIKERILGAVTVMNDTEAEAVWELIVANFPKRAWDDIETVTPDKWDEQMLANIEADPDCKEFISKEEAMKELGL